MEKSLFLQVLGDTPTMKVFDFLILNEEFDYSMTDIAELSCVGYSTLKLFWPVLEDQEIVSPTRIVGKAKMYRLNKSNTIAKKMIELYWTTTKVAVRKIQRQEEHMLAH